MTELRLPAIVKRIKETETTTILQMEIFEGHYRQIRRMCEAIFTNFNRSKKNSTRTH